MLYFALPGRGWRSPAGMSPGPGRPSIAAQEILDLVCHSIALVFSVAALTWELEMAFSVPARLPLAPTDVRAAQQEIRSPPGPFHHGSVRLLLRFSPPF